MRGLAGTAAPAAGLLLSIALFVHAGQLDPFSAPGQLGPSFWPRLTLAGLALACLAKLVAAWRRPRATSRPADASSRPAVSPGRLGAAVALVLLYAVATPVLGFPLATAGFVLGFMRLCGARSLLGALAAALVGTVGVLYLFVKLVYLPLPKGGGAFEAFSLALYRALHIF